MFKLLVSVTLVNFLIALRLFGPGISVFTVGPLGSPGNSGASPFVEASILVAAAVAVAYVLRAANLGASCKDLWTGRNILVAAAIASCTSPRAIYTLAHGSVACSVLRSTI